MKWIKTSDDLPVSKGNNSQRWVLLFCEGYSNEIYFGYYSDDGKWVIGDDYAYPDQVVSHWMDLPPAPKAASASN